MTGDPIVASRTALAPQIPGSIRVFPVALEGSAVFEAAKCPIQGTVAQQQFAFDLGGVAADLVAVKLLDAR